MKSERDISKGCSNIRTAIWTADYNAQNRSVRFTRENTDGTRTMITAAYDYLGRRAWKKVETITTNAETGEETATVTLHQRYIYRGYLQVAACDLTRGGHPCLWLITWDPTQPTATRPLAIQKDGTWYCYGWDLTKNICEVFGQAGYIRTTYSYTPYGSVTEEGDVTQPIQWSSEYGDPELGLIYYNYRYYNPADGRWIRRDMVEGPAHNFYSFVCNNSCLLTDNIGLRELFVSYIFESGGLLGLTKRGIVTTLTELTRLREDYVQVIYDDESFKPNLLCREEDCIKKMIIFAHGSFEDKKKMAIIYMYDSDDYNTKIESADDYKFFSNFINSSNIKFCKNAILELRICNIGKLPQIAHRIEQYYDKINLEVISYPYSIFPSGLPNLHGLYQILFE